MEDFDRSNFVVAGPLWAAVDRRSLGTDQNGNTVIIDPRGIQSGDVNGRLYVVLFTDKDNAKKFVEWKDKLNLVAMPFDSPRTLARVLEDLQAVRYESVLLDVTQEGKRAHDVPIAVLLKALRKPPA